MSQFNQKKKIKKSNNKLRENENLSVWHQKINGGTKTFLAFMSIKKDKTQKSINQRNKKK